MYYCPVLRITDSDRFARCCLDNWKVKVVVFIDNDFLTSFCSNMWVWGKSIWKTIDSSASDNMVILKSNDNIVFTGLRGLCVDRVCERNLGAGNDCFFDLYHLSVLSVLVQFRRLLVRGSVL